MRSGNGSPARDRGPDCPVCAAPATRWFSDVGDRRYWRCGCCVATFLDPGQRPGAGRERREYDLHRNDPADAGYRRFLARLAEPLIDRLAAGAHGLDYGCGPGPAMPAMLAGAGFRVETWDPLYDARAEALARRYDFITCTEVIEHAHAPAEVFRRLDRLLRPGGLLGLMTAFQTDDARFAGWHYRRDPTHVVFFREQTLRFVAGRTGWAIEIPRAGVAILRKPPS